MTTLRVNAHYSRAAFKWLILKSYKLPRSLDDYLRHNLHRNRQPKQGVRCDYGRGNFRYLGAKANPDRISQWGCILCSLIQSSNASGRAVSHVVHRYCGMVVNMKGKSHRNELPMGERLCNRRSCLGNTRAVK